MNKKNFLYILTMENSDLFKVGVTNDIEKRLSNIQTGNPNKIRILFCDEMEDAYKIESRIKIKYKKYIKNGEWYGGINPEDIKKFIFKELIK